MLEGFHVWNKDGGWVGVYETHSRAQAHTRIFTTDKKFCVTEVPKMPL